MIIIDIACEISEAKTRSLMKKRDRALRKKDYDKVWRLDMAIDKSRSQTFSLSSWEIWV